MEQSGLAQTQPRGRGARAWWDLGFGLYLNPGERIWGMCSFEAAASHGGSGQRARAGSEGWEPDLASVLGHPLWASSSSPGTWGDGHSHFRDNTKCLAESGGHTHLWQKQAVVIIITVVVLLLTSPKRQNFAFAFWGEK